MIVSDYLFEWFASGVVAATAVGWASVEIIRLRRELRRAERDPDKVFGSIVAIAIMAVGLAGVLKHHLT